MTDPFRLWRTLNISDRGKKLQDHQSWTENDPLSHKISPLTRIDYRQEPPAMVRRLVLLPGTGLDWVVNNPLASPVKKLKIFQQVIDVPLKSWKSTSSMHSYWPIYLLSKYTESYTVYIEKETY